MKPLKERSWWRIVRIVLAWAIILAGVVGLFLPFLQGILLIIAGLALLAKDSPWARGVLERAKAWAKKRYKGYKE